MASNKPTFLAGDIGGTKTTLAVIDPDAGVRAPLHKVTYPSGKFDSLEAIVRQFLQQGDGDFKVRYGSFGVAGPVVNRQARITNLPWVMDEAGMAADLGFPVRLLNDLEAIAHAVPHLLPEDLETLHAGSPVEGGALAVIAPGTGLGEAFLGWDGHKYLPFPSEGGHADFAPADPDELDLLVYLQPRFGHVSWERICSGSGLPNLYDYLKQRGSHPEPDWLAAKLAAVSDVTPVIVQTALHNQAEICVDALDLFVKLLGSEAGNLALKVLATGGIYLGGGIPPRILSFLKKDLFLKAVCEKGRFKEALAQIPVHVILNPEAGLFGAAQHGLEHHRDQA